MPTRIILLLCTPLFILSAVTFDHMPAPKQRVAPTDEQTVLSFADAIAKAKDSIVYIATTQERPYANQLNPLLERFFGKNHPAIPPQRQSSLGSGVIATPDGYIITNNHVVDGAESIVVKIPGDETEYPAKIIGSDDKSDIAVIKIDAGGLKPIRMGDSDAVRIGDVVFAIGNPFGVGLSVTQGIVSARHKNGMGINEYENFIQTDASINPGNSGGALVDSRGALVGINAAIISRSGGNNGIGFAIESNMVERIAQTLIEHGKVKRGYIGVSITDLSGDLRQIYESQEGAVVIDVLPESPAAGAGVQRGDLIVALDGLPVRNAGDLKNRIGMLDAQSSVTLTYERDGKRRSAEMKLQGETPPETTAEAAPKSFEGLGLAPLDERLRRFYRIPDDVEGVFIEAVAPDSKAYRQHIAPGDIIVQVEQTPVDSVEGLHKAWKAYEGRKVKRVYLYRNGAVFIAVL